jgi:hypothetical protein
VRSGRHPSRTCETASPFFKRTRLFPISTQKKRRFGSSLPWLGLPQTKKELGIEAHLRAGLPGESQSALTVRFKLGDYFPAPDGSRTCGRKAESQRKSGLRLAFGLFAIDANAHEVSRA